jgi:hypothetical protein
MERVRVLTKGGVEGRQPGCPEIPWRSPKNSGGWLYLSKGGRCVGEEPGYVVQNAGSLSEGGHPPLCWFCAGSPADRRQIESASVAQIPDYIDCCCGELVVFALEFALRNQRPEIPSNPCSCKKD